jgi:hypothetical protein
MIACYIDYSIRHGESSHHFTCKIVKILSPRDVGAETVKSAAQFVEGWKHVFHVKNGSHLKIRMETFTINYIISI